MSDFDVVIVGAGIAGASIAAEISAHRRIALLEAEAQPGYHSTGRSAAFWSETYGGPDIQPLTSASGPFLLNPPVDFHDRPILSPRGGLHIGQPHDASLGDILLAEFASSGVAMERLDEMTSRKRIPGLRKGWSEALWEPDCADIDVAALHAAYLRKAKRQGVELRCNSALTGACWSGARWHIESRSGALTADVVVNAAGAWVDQVAIACGAKALDIQPYRRTIAQLEIDPPAPVDLPLVVGLDGSFYFKPDAGGRLWLSPHDETATPACDAAPEELDIAIAIDRMQQVVDWRIKRVEHSWAGLRSFAPDRLPVIGHDTTNPMFFWAAGQGGFGIQTAPAVAQLVASLLLESPLPKGINPELYVPARFT